MDTHNKLYSLIPLADFKAVLGIDDREDALARYCLITAAFTIEQYCKRRLLQKKYTDYMTFTGEPILDLKEYPVRKLLEVEMRKEELGIEGEALLGTGSLVNPEQYYCLPDEGINEDIPFSLVLRPPLRFTGKKLLLKARYVAGYRLGDVPADLASACLELAAWNMARFRGRRIGMAGVVRGTGGLKTGEQLATAMPENVRELLEPYRRRTI
jgi:hypothetical protein